MSGPIFETHVFTEILKSWWYRMQVPQVYYYRDKDGKEIDLLFAKDQALYPVEAKRSATPRREWVQTFSPLERLRTELGEGGVVCLSQHVLPLGKKATAIPVGLI